MRVLIIALAALCAAPPLQAQGARAAVSAGFGGGSKAIFAKTGSIDIDVWRSLGVTASIASLDHGQGVCNHSFPNPCNGDARTWAVGAVYAGRPSDRIRFRTSIGGGKHDFGGILVSTGVVDGGPRPMIAGEIGSELRVIGGLGVNLTYQRTFVLDDRDYRNTVGERLGYGLLLLGLSFTI